MMSRVEDIPAARRADRHAGEVPRASGGGRRTALSGVHAGGGRAMNGLTRGSAAIVGAAESDIGAVAASMSPLDLMAQGIHRALADCGLTLKDVDGMFCADDAGPHLGDVAVRVSRACRSAYTDSTIVGGSSFEVHVAHAQAALAAGLCSVAVIAYGSTQRTVGRRQAVGARIQSVRDAVPAVPARDRLCAGRVAPHARVRHHARTACRGGGGGARMGAAEPGRVGEEAADHRGRADRRGRSAIRSPCATAALSPMAAAPSS